MTLTVNTQSDIDAPFLRDLLVILVVYRQVPRDCATIRSLEQAFNSRSGKLDVFIYDNSATRCEVKDLPDPQLWSVTYLHDPTNPGVSTAYHAGAAFAGRHSKRWLLMVDQDTSFPPDALQQYVAALSEHEGVSVFSPILRAGDAVISPCAYRFLRGSALRTVAPGYHLFGGMSILNSGMCISLETYLSVGGHDVQIPLDFSDHEFVDRLKKVVPGFVVINAVASHGLSAVGTPTASEAANRFVAYATGALRTSRSLPRRVGAVAVVFGRAIVLALRYRRLRFLSTALNAVYHGR
jgi:GT2 family glycosyltransferase